MNQDAQNLDLLAIFHYIVGAITILTSSIFLIHVGIGIALISGAFHDGNPPPPGFGWLFVIFGSLAVLAGWTLGVLMVIAGRRLKMRKSRTFCLVIAAIECMLAPFGTVLGVFTIVVLMKESVTQLFSSSDQTPAFGG
jgi:hypothetical protein